jgi:hypothetical protein
MVSFLHTWLLFPALLVVLCLGCGLVVRRALGANRSALPALLVLPVGLATIVVIAVLLTYVSATAAFAAPAVAIVALVGLALHARHLKTGLRRPGRRMLWPALAALLPAAAIAMPIVLTGDPGFTGYGRIVDISHQFDLAAQLQQDGRAIPGVADSSSEENLSKLLRIGYPSGIQAAHGSVASLAGLDIAWAYQPFLAVIGAMLGLALYSLLGRIIPSRPLRAVAAGIAAQPTILYSYTLTGGVKELAVAAMLALLAALLAAHRPSMGPIRALLPVALATAAGFAVFNLAILPWLGILLAVVFAVDLAWAHGHRVRTFGRWAVLGTGIALLSVPGVLGAIKLAPPASAGGPADLGNLAAPVPAWATAGVWLTGDHRYPLTQFGNWHPTRLLAAGVLALALIGLVRAVRQRDAGTAALAAAGAVAVPFVIWQSGPWVELKAFSVTAPVVLALAFAGAAALLASSRLRRLAPFAAAAVAIAVLAGNAMVYRETTIAPYERLSELEDLGNRYAGEGPTLYPFFEEYASYFMREMGSVELVDPPASRSPQYTEAAREGIVFARDTDEFQPDYLRTFETIVLRRDPVGSRPPSGFKLVERTDYHEVWQRDPDAPPVLSHIALTGRADERTRSFCTDLVDELRSAGPGARLAYAAAEDVVQVSSDGSEKPRLWDFAAPDFLARGPGRLELDVSLPYPDEWAVWLRGSFGREVRVLVNGEEIESLRWQQSYPLQYEPLGTISLPAGDHRIEIIRGGGSLLPGTANDIGNNTITIGPIAFVPADPPAEVESVPRGEAMETCRSEERFDWVEIIRPDGPAASDASLSAVPPPRPPA